MSFVRYSSQAVVHQKVNLDTMFVLEYLPSAPEQYIKVYVYGMMLASYEMGADNSLEKMARRLDLPESVVVEAYNYWAEFDLVRIIDSDPLTVEYLPVSAPVNYKKKYDETKYADFNSQLHWILPNRTYLPNEYREYYDLIETLHIEKEALLSIIGYCVRVKGINVSYQYIAAVARNLAREGLLTFDAVEQQLSEFKAFDKEIRDILRCLKTKRKPDHNDEKLYISWVKRLGFDHVTVQFVAKTVKKGGMERLNAMLRKYHELQLVSQAEIKTYLAEREMMISLAKKINRIIGVYYEQLDYIIEKYIATWMALGYQEDALLTIADYCFRQNIRSLEGMHDYIQRFCKQGLVSIEAIQNYALTMAAVDQKIAAILEKAGVVRQVVARDRDLYRTWTYTWMFEDEVIDHAAALARDKASPIAYMNSLLADWQQKGIKSLASVMQERPISPPSKPTDSTTKPKVMLTAEQLNAMFDNLKDEDV